MTDYAKLYARLCGAIDEVLDELGTIPEARHAREKLQAAILDAEAQYLDAAEDKMPARLSRAHFICYSVNSSACCASAPISVRQAAVMAATCSGQRPI